jgi:hypothetical protein
MNKLEEYKCHNNPDNSETMTCNRCGKTALCEEAPMMGWSEWLCQKCAYAAYRSGDSV